MGMFDKFVDSAIFENPCPPGCETCCPLDIQLAFDPVINRLTLTYIYDNAIVVRTVDLTDLQEPLTIGLTFNSTTNIITLAGIYAGVPFTSDIDISASIPPPLGPLCYCEDNLVYYNADGTLLLTEYIIVITQNSIFVTLPATPLIGQMYKIYCTSNDATIVANGVQDIVGSGPTVNMVIGNGMIFQYIKQDQWGVINL